MGLADTFREQAEAIDLSSAALERGNALLERQLQLVEKVVQRMGDLQGTSPQGPPGLDPGQDPTKGGGGPLPGGPPPPLPPPVPPPPPPPGGGGNRTVTYQGPNGLLTEILGPDGRVISVVPVGPQSTPAGPLFGRAPSGTAAGDGSGIPSGGDTGQGLPRAVAPGVLPSPSGRGLTGTTGGGKTVVAPKDVLQKYCRATEYTIPDPNVPNASPTKGPWIRRTVWECPAVPAILPEGGTFTEDEKVAGGIGAGFIGRAATTETQGVGGETGGRASGAPGGGSTIGPGLTVAGSPTGFSPSGATTFAGSTAAPSQTGPTGPTPGERLLAGVARDLGKAIDKLAVKIGNTDGGLSLRTKGLTP